VFIAVTLVPQLVQSFDGQGICQTKRHKIEDTWLLPVRKAILAPIDIGPGFKELERVIHRKLERRLQPPGLCVGG
jgi:hypothetical protein